MAETVCPSCKKHIRGIPDDRPVKVTCSPRSNGCGAQFVYPPVERSPIAMRCARDGQHFRVVFRRDPGTTVFGIETVEPQRAPLSSAAADGANEASVSAQYNAVVYDWSAFYCACCGYVSPQDGYAIIQCGSCSSLVCASTLHEVAGAAGPERWFECHPDCGHQGKIDGIIQEFSSSRTKLTRIIPAGELTDQTEKPLRLGR